MLASARRYWGDVRSGFWFLPSLLLAAHVAIAIALTSTDLARNKPWMEQWPNLFGAGAEGARGMLSTIASSMMTVVGVTLSMTLVTLALASSQYTSRILRNFIRDRITQLVLGLFAGIYCYCVIVLRTIRGGDEGGFVPGLAVLFGVILAVGGMSVLIYFIHHIATSIQASNIIASVADETAAAVDRLYPEGRDAPSTGEGQTPARLPLQQLSPQWKPIVAQRDGYVQRIDVHGLAELAHTHGATFRIERATGDFVIKGTPLVSVLHDAPAIDELTRAVARAIDIGRHRTIDQDVGFGIRQLVDIALRALSPGVNDTTTAIMCVDYLTAILARLATRWIPDNPDSADRDPSLITARPHTFGALAGDAFDQIREAGRGNFAVLDRLLRAVHAIDSVTTVANRRQILREHVDLLDETAGRSVESQRDRERLAAMALQIRARLTQQPLPYLR